MKNLDKKFKRLVKKWELDTLILSDLGKIVAHPSYQKIIGMGESVLPLILGELIENRGHWHQALALITGENPVPDDVQGDHEEMTQCWVSWGVEKGLLKKPVCDDCNDTNRVWMEDLDRYHLCQRCPTPCDKCATGEGRGPYCETTPCECSCHKDTGIGEEPQVYKTNAGLGHRQYYYVIRLDKTEHGYDYFVVGGSEVITTENMVQEDLSELDVELSDFQLPPVLETYLERMIEKRE